MPALRNILPILAFFAYVCGLTFALNSFILCSDHGVLAEDLIMMNWIRLEYTILLAGILSVFLYLLLKGVLNIYFNGQKFVITTGKTLQ